MRKKLLSAALAVFLAASSLPVSSVRATEVPQEKTVESETTEVPQETSEGNETVELQDDSGALTETAEETTEDQNADEGNAAESELSDETDESSEETVSELPEMDDVDETEDDMEIADDLQAEEETVAAPAGQIAVNETNFPDEAFRKYLSKSFDSDGDGYIDPNGVTSIYISDSIHPKNVTGIEKFANLKNFSADSQNLENFDLSHNTKLTHLSFYGIGGITELDLSNNLDLEYLWITYAVGFANLDVSNHTKLKTLNLHGTDISVLNAEGCPLDHFALSWNSDNSEKYKIVKEINLSNTDLKSLTVSTYPNLEKLDVSGSEITSLNVSKNTNLNSLDASDTAISSLDVSQNKKLTELKVPYPIDLTVNSASAPGHVTLCLAGMTDQVDLSRLQGVTFADKTGRYNAGSKCLMLKGYIQSNLGIGRTEYSSNWSKTENGSKTDITVHSFKYDQTRSVTVTYRTHVQSFGWQNKVTNGAVSGTSGKAKRLEAIEISVSGANLGIQYTTHCQSYGWIPWSANGELSGTEGEAKRLEAIKIRLTGSDKSKYNVFYRVHAQSYGWLGWAKNGAPAGTAGLAKRLEAIQIVVLPKGTAAPGIDYNGVKASSNVHQTKAYISNGGKTKGPRYYSYGDGYDYESYDADDPLVYGYNESSVEYRTHVQSYGWQSWKYSGGVSGTVGQAKRLEGINIKLTNKKYSGDIVYTTHVQSYGWQGKENDESTWKKNGQMSGTSGQAKRLEAIRINLTGEMAEHYDIYYRVHAQTYGWLNWAKNGAPAGTAGLAKRLEGIQIVLWPKDTEFDTLAYEWDNKTALEKAYIVK